MEKFTYKEVKDYIEGINGNGCKLLSTEYINCMGKLQIQCRCGDIFETTFNDFKNYNKNKCNTCSFKIMAKKRSFTYEEVKHFVEVESSSGCKLLSKEYKGTHNKLQFQCKCGNEFETTFSKFKHRNKRQCNECGMEKGKDKLRKTQEQFETEVRELVGNEYSVVGDYINTETHILLKHNICNHIWYITPSNFLRGRRCPKCNRPNYNRDTKKFKQELYNLVKDEYSLLNEYIDTYNHVLLRHNKCGHEWHVLPDNFLYRGSRCPQCAETKGEEVVRKYLEDNNINFKKEHSFNDLLGIGSGLLKFDFYLPELDVCIEYDGIQHFEPIDFFGGEKQFKYQKINDRLKNTYCRNNNIDLLRIPYTEFDNIEGVINGFLNDYTVDSAM